MKLCLPRIACALVLAGCLPEAVTPQAPDGAAPGPEGPDLMTPEHRPQHEPVPALEPRWGLPPRPTRLSQTGLYSSIKDRTLASGVVPFRPTYELWSDGAEKGRWIQLPAGKKIDTSNMNRWVFPVGVKLWKEFRKDGKLLETRLVWKVGSSGSLEDWLLLPFVWDEAEQDATLVIEGVDRVRGTTHSVPNQAACRSCHTYLQERPLGFAALQLSGSGTGVRLRDLAQQGLLTHPPANPDAFVPPGDATAKAALGYLHANCGGCHATDTDFSSASVDLALRLEIGKLDTVKGTPTFTTTSEKLTTSLKGGLRGAMVRLRAGKPAESAMYFRMGERVRDPESLQMPPYGSDQIDTVGRAAVGKWISELTP